MEALLKLPQVRLSELQDRISRGKYFPKQQPKQQKSTRNLSCSGFDVLSPYYYYTRCYPSVCTCKGPKCFCCWVKPKDPNDSSLKFLSVNKNPHSRHQMPKMLAKTTTQPNQPGKFPSKNKFPKLTTLTHQNPKKKRKKSREVEFSTNWISDLEEYVKKQFQKIHQKTKITFEQKHQVKCDETVRNKLLSFLSNEMTTREGLLLPSKNNTKNKKSIVFGKIFKIEDELLGERFGKMLCMSTSEQQSEEDRYYLKQKKSKKLLDKKVIKRRKSTKRKKGTEIFEEIYKTHLQKQKEQQDANIEMSATLVMEFLSKNELGDEQQKFQKELQGLVEKFAQLDFVEYRKSIEEIWVRVSTNCQEKNGQKENLQKFECFLDALDKKLLEKSIKNNKIQMREEKAQEIKKICGFINAQKSKRYLKSSKKMLSATNLKSSKSALSHQILPRKNDQKDSKESRSGQIEDRCKNVSINKSRSCLDSSDEKKKSIRPSMENQIRSEDEPTAEDLFRQQIIEKINKKRHSNRIRSRASKRSEEDSISDSDSIEQLNEQNQIEKTQLLEENKDQVLNLADALPFKKNKGPSIRFLKTVSDRSRSSRSSSIDRRSTFLQNEQEGLQQEKNQQLKNSNPPQNLHTSSESKKVKIAKAYKD